jgi:hypothetical protein
MIQKYFAPLLVSMLLLFSYSSFSQAIGIGEWRDHLPYNQTVSLTEGLDRIYTATPYSIFYFDQNDNSINRISRINGLSDIGISRIGFNKETQTLLIAYSNTNIDLVKNGTVINMSDILESNAITPEEKTIFNIHFIDELAYLSCGFGITVIDIQREEVSDTYYIGPDGSHLAVYDLEADENYFYAATASGIYTAEISNPNLAYFASWTKDQTLPFPDAAYNHITIHANKLFTNKYSTEWDRDTIVYHNGNEWIYDSDLFSNADIFGLKVFNDKLYIPQRYSVNIYDENLNKLEGIWTYSTASPGPRDLIVDNNTVWIADEYNGLVRQNGSYDYTFIHPNGPGVADVYALSAVGKEVWSVAGGKNAVWGSLFNWGSCSSFSSEDWTYYDKETQSAFDTIRDMVSVAIDPTNTNRVYAGSWNRGLVEFVDGEVRTVYNKSNSSLDYNMIEGSPVIKVGGLEFDDQGNLWATNSGANNILSVKIPGGGPDGTWQSFYLGSAASGKDIGDVIIDNSGQKWIQTRESYTLFVFNDNGTLTNPSDDQTKKLSNNVGNGNIPGTKIHSLANDLDGEVWIGTDEGIAVFYSPENVFTNFNYDAQRILIPRNDGTGLADILLEFETITAIAIDGANNKWIGTDRSGVYLLSPDGQEEIHHFTTSNSPLFSNNITSIAIDSDGEVFIGTAKGLISYKGEATPGGTTNTDVYAYPNPVRPGYAGPIAIKGLLTNANVKITNINGALVYSGIAEGGQFVWNGKNFSGTRAQSGVYLVFISNDDGSETLVTKIMFIN